MESYRAQFDQWLATKNVGNVLGDDATNELALAMRTVLSAESDHRLAKRKARPKKVTIQEPDDTPITVERKALRNPFSMTKALNIDPVHPAQWSVSSSSSSSTSKARADARHGYPQPSQSSGLSSKQTPKWEQKTSWRHQRKYIIKGHGGTFTRMKPK